MEKVCLEIENIEVSYLDRVVLDVPRLAVHQFDRIGVVGKNGSGKSTLLKLMNGQIEPDQGHVKRFIDFAYFDQLSYPLETDVDYKLLGELDIPQTELQNYSGGEQTRLKLAQIFSHYHEGLLFDEPTTHLDQEGVQFFIDQLTYYYGALIIVSHDRHLLDQLVTKIWEVDEGKVTEYTGNYTDYVEQKELQKQQQQEQHEKYLKEKDRLIKAANDKKKKAEKVTKANGQRTKKDVNAKANLMFMTKSKDTSQKSIQRAAKAIEQRIDQLEEVDAPVAEKKIRFHQPNALKLHNQFPIMADRLTLKAGEKNLLNESSFQFPLGKTIAITGSNGSGKTTLIHHIIENGEGITLSPKAVIGYYGQMDYQFTEEQSALEYMKDQSDYEEVKIRAVLNSMSFAGNDLKKKVNELSGGEAIRLVLSQLFLGRYNVLILDEPTNFLDVVSTEALERFLEGYEGTVILVSHDHTFVRNVADEVYSIENETIIKEY
ncbi:Msr family ABC-F type ribosomal protection protein [Alkalibacillus haloalkaliphilus]|uniref:Msr family ABC-F type ribosomal protection protein n=1 Tax=Alkalibacillus haloalkaliphilus TaxID=94136 RepID=UPI0002E6C2A3|nr:ABC-F type ribosomal protection protein [Alkalibacillus haloalkaliphilus]